MNTITTAVLMALLAPGGPAGGDGDPVVTLRCKSEAMIRGTSILIRDVADVEAADRELSTRIGDIRLAHRPAFGFNRVFSASDLTRALVQAGLSIEQLKLSGASEVLAQPLTTLLTPGDIREAADPVLRAALDLDPNSDVEFDLTSSLRPLRVPPGRLDLNLRAKLRGGRLNATSASVDVSVVVDGEVFKNIPINYRLRRYVHALVASRAIKKGEPFTTENLEARRLEAAPGSTLYLTSFSQAESKVAAGNIGHGKVVQLAHLTLPAAVFRNDPVRLVSRRGRVMVTARALALQDAPIGGRIQVRNISTGSVVQAVVHAPGIVVLPHR